MRKISVDPAASAVNVGGASGRAMPRTTSSLAAEAHQHERDEQGDDEQAGEDGELGQDRLLLEGELERAVVRIVLRRGLAGDRALGAEREVLARRRDHPVDGRAAQERLACLGRELGVDLTAGWHVDDLVATA